MHPPLRHVSFDFFLPPRPGREVEDAIAEATVIFDVVEPRREHEYWRRVEIDVLALALLYDRFSPPGLPSSSAGLPHSVDALLERFEDADAAVRSFVEETLHRVDWAKRARRGGAHGVVSIAEQMLLRWRMLPFLSDLP